MKLIFMGTPDFAVPVLEELIKRGHEVGYAVTQPDRAGNRGRITFSSVKKAALVHGITVLQPENLNKAQECKRTINDFAPEAIVVVAYGQILKKEILNAPKYGCFNVHASLLPKFRGAAPMQHAILSGEQKTGITVMRMNEGLDEGDIAAKAETCIGDKNFRDIHDELSEMGAVLMADTLQLLENGEITYAVQDSEAATYAPKITKSDGKIDFGKRAEAVRRQIRAFDPWPGAFCEYKDKKLKIWNGTESWDKATCGEDVSPGEIVAASAQGLYVACGEGTLKITELQLQGKKRMHISNFIRGTKIKTGEILF